VAIPVNEGGRRGQGGQIFDTAALRGAEMRSFASLRMTIRLRMAKAVSMKNGLTRIQAPAFRASGSVTMR
jgi:hypothetical protein